MKTEGKSTIMDLASRLGLDKSTVSLALRGSSRISDKTRQRVRQAALELGYRPNLAARLLASKSPQVVGLLLPGDLQGLREEVTVRTIQGLARGASAANMMLVVLAGQDLFEVGREGQGAGLQPDGLLVWGSVSANVAGALHSPARPAVVLDPNDASYASYAGPAVRIDNAGGAAQIVSHLLEQGTERLLFVQADPNHLGHQQRWRGARECWLASRSLDGLSFCCLDELTDSLLAAFVAGPNASIFCSNDLCAMEVWHRLAKAGVSVPGQVLLAGFDGDRSGGLIGLTTALFDCDGLAQKGFELLTGLLKSPATAGEPVILSVQMRPGLTTRRIAAQPPSST